jgi:hypothetical protein
MARRKVIWHIGPADPGTDFLSTALAAARPALDEHGVHVPSGAWHEIENLIWKHKDTSLLSTPGISRADQSKIALRLSGLRDLEVHLVLLVRDLPAQVHAAWQSDLQHGSTTSLSKYADRVLDPERSHWQAEEFWVGRDLARILPLWTRAIHPDRVHVVAAPRDPDEIWAALTARAGVPEISRPEGLVPPSLGAELDPERVLDITTSWAKMIADRGFDMHGSLINASAEAITTTDRAEHWEALTSLLTATSTEVKRLSAEVTRLRAENAHLDQKRRKHKRRVSKLTAGG